MRGQPREEDEVDAEDTPIDFALPIAVAESGVAAAERLQRVRTPRLSRTSSVASVAAATPTAGVADEDASGRRGTRRVVGRGGTPATSEAPSPAPSATREKRYGTA